MKNKKGLSVYLFACFCLASTMLHAQEIKIEWGASQGAKGYRVYESVDEGQNWQMVLDTAGTNATLEMPAHGLVLIRISAYNDAGETIRSESGIWFNADWASTKESSLQNLENIFGLKVNAWRNSGWLPPPRLAVIGVK